MEDNELLELSANAKGINIEYRRGSDAYYYDDPDTGREQWCPLDDDRQALRLAIDLDMILTINRVDGWSEASGGFSNADLVKKVELHGDDMYDATRRVIVRAAAEIGKSLK